MATDSVRQRLANYLQIVDENKIKVVFMEAGDGANTEACDWDEDFIKEMELRSQSFVDGTAKTYTWEETKQAAIEKVKSRIS